MKFVIHASGHMIKLFNNGWNYKNMDAIDHIQAFCRGDELNGWILKTRMKFIMNHKGKTNTNGWKWWAISHGRIYVLKSIT
jgi:hypothetical protein